MRASTGRRLATAGLLVALTGCADEADPATDAAGTVEAPAAASAPEPEWGYDGAIGPERWDELDLENAECATGQQQSPIDLSEDLATPDPADVPPVTYDYEPATFEVVDVGHTIQASPEDAGGGLTLGGESYELAQFHVHAPSEHAIDGERTNLAVHLVHQNADGELAVVGVLVEAGDAASGLATAWEELPYEGETVTLPDFDASTLLPDDRTTFRYTGSLTTPPCTEGVQWLVMRDVVTAEPEVVSSVEELVAGTARPLQPANERDVVLATDS